MREPGQLLADIVVQILADAPLLVLGDRKQFLLQRMAFRDIADHNGKEPARSDAKLAHGEFDRKA